MVFSLMTISEGMAAASSWIHWDPGRPAAVAQSSCVLPPGAFVVVTGR